MPNFEESFIDGYSDHTIGIASCIYAVARGAEIIEKHYSNNKSLNVATQQAHTCSMNFNDLSMIREISDSLTLIRNKK
jgi:sialic acid synthase SpsE